MGSEASHTTDFTTAKDNDQTKIVDEKAHAYSLQDVPHYKTLYPHINESRVVRKIDLRLVPILSALYVLAFLDRVNIGNAALFGLKQDLKLGGNEYNTALVIFFVPYILFEVPSNFLMKKLKPHVWLPICLFGFGLVTILQGLTQNYSGLLATRFFLGLFEAGMLPGCFYLISMWYRRAEAQKRFTFFFSSTSLAGAFGGLLASAIGKMNGMRGYLGWRWVFILEGVLTCACALFFFFLIPDFPEEANWLSPDEKAFIHARLKDDVGASGINESMSFRRALDIIKQYKVTLAALMYFGLIVPAYSLVYFSPSIIQSLGTSNTIHTQLLSVPPYACAFVVGMLVAAFSDYFQHRFSFIILGLCVSLTGFIILIIEHHNAHLQYAAIFLAATGTYSSMPIILCWFSMNVRGHMNRAVATGWQIGFGNIGGIIASYSFVAKDAPRYIKGYSICIGFVCLTAVTTFLYLFNILAENRKLSAERTKDAECDSRNEKEEVYRYFT